MGVILYQGHSSFRLITDRGLIFYIDPYKAEQPGFDIPADVILVTHDHFDHNNIDIVPKKSDCTIVTSKEALVDGEYNGYEINDILVEAVPAYNKFHEKENCVGYMINVDGKQLYFTGDTAYIDEMPGFKEKNVDLMFVPMDGYFTMDTEEAKKCVEAVGAKFAIPIHTSPQYQKDDDKMFDLDVAQSLDIQNKIIIKPGESLVL